MATSYFKDIYNYLCKKHPNKKIYISSDHHFYHFNIIKYERSQFSDINQMNEYIINCHNSVITEDDIIIFLGDFSFRKGAIGELLSRMNGHKYLLLGNHDDLSIIRSYGNMGFEGVFTNPVKMNDIYLSHQPLKDGYLDDLNFELLVKEFGNSTGINYHGHDHIEEAGEPPYINVCCESQGFKPLFIGYTEGVIKTTDAPLIINSDYFEEILRSLEKEKTIDSRLLVADYIYAHLLESITPYSDSFFVYGSYPLYKSYGYISNFSDLDVCMIYNENASNKFNQNQLRKIFYTAFEFAKEIDTLNLSIFKRLANVSIFELLYADNSGNNYRGYFDSNLVPINVYRDTDFVTVAGQSAIEKMIGDDPNLREDFRFPRYQARFLTLNGSIANIILQLLFQRELKEKHDVALKKLRYIYKTNGKCDVDNISQLEDSMSRFLIRNLMFFHMTSRRKEIEYIKDGFNNLDELLSSFPHQLRWQLEKIIKNPNSLFNSLYNELSHINYEELPAKSRELIRNLK